MVWVIRHSNMCMSETRLYHIVRECATELVTKHLCMNMSKGLYMYMSQNQVSMSNKTFVYEYGLYTCISQVLFVSQ